MNSRCADFNIARAGKLIAALTVFASTLAVALPCIVP
jgi:hypothetical protein